MAHERSLIAYSGKLKIRRINKIVLSYWKECFTWKQRQLKYKTKKIGNNMLNQMNVQPDQKCSQHSCSDFFLPTLLVRGYKRTYSMGMQHAPFSRGWAIGKYSSKKKQTKLMSPLSKIHENLILIQRIRNRLKNELRYHYAPLCHKVDIEFLYLKPGLIVLRLVFIFLLSANLRSKYNYLIILPEQTPRAD